MKSIFKFLLSGLLSCSFAAQAQEDKTQDSPEEFKKHIYFPLAYYTPETSFAFGFIDIYNFWKEKEGKFSQVQSVLSYSVKEQYIVRVAPKFYFSGGEKEVGGALFYSYYPNQFYGLTEHLETPEKYIENNFRSSLYGAYNFYSQFYLRSELLSEKRKIIKTESDGELRSYLEATGFDQVDVTGVSLGVDWDSRDYPQSPLSGSLHRIAVTQFQDKNQKWQKQELALKKYISISAGVWAQELTFEKLTEKELPLTSYLSIGGNNRLRGYYAGEYRSTHLAIYQTEYRGVIKNKFGYSVFVGMAKLGDDFSRLGGQTTRSSFGAGISYLLDSSSRTKLKLDYGLSGDNSGVYFVLGEAF